MTFVTYIFSRFQRNYSSLYRMFQMQPASFKPPTVLQTWRKYLKGPAAEINSTSHWTVRAVSLLLRPSPPTSRCGRDRISIIMTNLTRWRNRMWKKNERNRKTRSGVSSLACAPQITEAPESGAAAAWRRCIQLGFELYLVCITSQGQTHPPRPPFQPICWEH